ncbi:MAG: TraR/DksA family transcriptional regulator [Candidatus Doudnabacteria bacterium]|nr:TraR/DksA family transcriptional regulator [Candidatus Doudnabacteria bacterium]
MAKKKDSRQQSLPFERETLRNRVLGEILLSRQREVMAALKPGREAWDTQPGDQAECSAGQTQHDLDAELTAMRCRTLRLINTALSRLQKGDYGECKSCGDEIAEARLRSLPFAIRCKTCEDQREMREERERLAEKRAMKARGSSPLAQMLGLVIP